MMLPTYKHTDNRFAFHIPNYKVLATIILVSVLSLKSTLLRAQIVWLGLKAGGELNQPKLADIHFRDTVKTQPSPGFSIGGALMFKVKNRYFLHTEYLYSVKTKMNTGKIDPMLKDRTVYQYLEVPILFTMQFKIRLGKEKNFKWYGGVGPNVAYLLNGKGVIKSGELFENKINSQSYNVVYGSRGPNRDRLDRVYYTGVNRFQFGLNFGAGILLEPVTRRKVIIDVRYTLDQTLFGKKSADYLAPDDYNDNLKFRNRSLKFSVIYLFEYNLNKKERHKGKSTIKPKTR